MSNIQDFMIELIDNVGSEKETELSDRRKELIHSFVEENGVNVNCEKQRQDYLSYIKENNLTAEDIYKDMLAKCAYAPTIVHLYMVPKLLLPIIDKKIWEESNGRYKRKSC